MFKWLLKQRNKTKTPPEFDLLNNKEIVNYINQLKSLVSVTQQDFESLYFELIKRVLEYVFSLSHFLSDQADNKMNVFNMKEYVNQLLEKTLMALKCRKGYLLPLGADSETCFREREEWTYAVFSAALLKPLYKVLKTAFGSYFDSESTNECSLSYPDNILKIGLIKIFMPHDGFMWLFHNKRLFSEWLQYLCSIDESFDGTQNGIIKIILLATSSASLPKNNTTNTQTNVNITKIEKNTEIESNLEATENSNNPIIQSESDIHTENENLTITEVDLNNLEPEYKQEELQDKIQSTETIEDIIIEDDTQEFKNEVLPEFHVKDFFEWLKSDINHQQLKINATDSYIHIVKEGCLLLVPQALRQFLEYQAKTLNLSNLTNLLKRQIELTRKIKQSGLLLRKEDQGFIFTYYYGNWQERKTLSGFLVSVDYLFDQNNLPAINNDLILDPINNI